jgi:hypothetical protein
VLLRVGQRVDEVRHVPVAVSGPAHSTGIRSRSSSSSSRPNPSPSSRTNCGQTWPLRGSMLPPPFPGVALEDVREFLEVDRERPELRLGAGREPCRELIGQVAVAVPPSLAQSCDPGPREFRSVGDALVEREEHTVIAELQMLRRFDLRQHGDDRSPPRRKTALLSRPLASTITADESATTEDRRARARAASVSRPDPAAGACGGAGRVRRVAGAARVGCGVVFAAGRARRVG